MKVEAKTCFHARQDVKVVFTEVQAVGGRPSHVGGTLNSPTDARPFGVSSTWSLPRVLEPVGP